MIINLSWNCKGRKGNLSISRAVQVVFLELGNLQANISSDFLVFFVRRYYPHIWVIMLNSIGGVITSCYLGLCIIIIFVLMRKFMNFLFGVQKKNVCSVCIWSSNTLHFIEVTELCYINLFYATQITYLYIRQIVHLQRYTNNFSIWVSMMIPIPQNFPNTWNTLQIYVMNTAFPN